MLNKLIEVEILLLLRMRGIHLEYTKAEFIQKHIYPHYFY